MNPVMMKKVFFQARKIWNDANYVMKRRISLRFIKHYDVLLIVFQKEPKRGICNGRKNDLDKALKSSRSGFSFTARPYCC